MTARRGAALLLSLRQSPPYRRTLAGHRIAITPQADLSSSDWSVNQVHSSARNAASRKIVWDFCQSLLSCAHTLREQASQEEQSSFLTHDSPVCVFHSKHRACFWLG